MNKAGQTRRIDHSKSTVIANGGLETSKNSNKRKKPDEEIKQKEQKAPYPEKKAPAVKREEATPSSSSTSNNKISQASPPTQEQVNKQIYPGFDKGIEELIKTTMESYLTKFMFETTKQRESDNQNLYQKLLEEINRKFLEQNPSLNHQEPLSQNVKFEHIEKDLQQLKSELNQLRECNHKQWEENIMKKVQAQISNSEDLISNQRKMKEFEGQLKELEIGQEQFLRRQAAIQQLSEQLLSKISEAERKVEPWPEQEIEAKMQQFNQVLIQKHDSLEKQVNSILEKQKEEYLQAFNELKLSVDKLNDQLRRQTSFGDEIKGSLSQNQQRSQVSTPKNNQQLNQEQAFSLSSLKNARESCDVVDDEASAQLQVQLDQITSWLPLVNKQLALLVLRQQAIENQFYPQIQSLKEEFENREQVINGILNDWYDQISMLHSRGINQQIIRQAAPEKEVLQINPAKLIAEKVGLQKQQRLQERSLEELSNGDEQQGEDSEKEEENQIKSESESGTENGQGGEKIHSVISSEELETETSQEPLIEQKLKCMQCKTDIFEDIYFSKCNHAYHKNCLQSLVDESARKQQTFVQCQECGDKIPLNWLSVQFAADQDFQDSLRRCFTLHLKQLSLPGYQKSRSCDVCSFWYFTTEEQTHPLSDTKCLQCPESSQQGIEESQS